MKLYHGSDKIIEKPVFGGGKPYNDYGPGFYCTEDYELAGEWAVSFERDGYINTYSIDLRGLSVLDLNSPDYCILDWLEILLENRRFDIQSDFGMEASEYLKKNFHTDHLNCDLIKGYRADDSYFSFAQDFLNNTISLSTLERAMKLGNLGEQIVLKSKKSFTRIVYEESSRAGAMNYFPKKEKRDKNAREDYRSLRGKSWRKGEIYMMQILERELKRDDIRV
ncbi:MAG: DUF3990 domain-containing protein [Lachnospiraceae bacterium]|nr:DUF3990 domain-containing protein [Lachnospiraceae bacterium]